MSDRDIKSWDQRLKDQVICGWENYVRQRIHLDSARGLESWSVAGEFLYIEEVSSKSARASVRLNRNTNPELDLEKGCRIETVFQTLYISNAAQPGEWVDLIIGINFKYFKPAAGDIASSETQPCKVMTNVAADTNTIGAAQICNQALVKADVKNTGIVWVDFGTAAVQDACMPLDPGEFVRVSLSNLNRINANFEVADERLFVVYEL